MTGVGLVTLVTLVTLERAFCGAKEAGQPDGSSSRFGFVRSVRRFTT